MNTYWKVASAAALSAVTLSVAALSVPAIKAHALKVIADLGIDHAPVAQVTVKNEAVSGAPVMDPPVAVAFREVNLDKPTAPSNENSGNAFGAVAGAGNSNPQSTTNNGMRSFPGGDVSSSGSGANGASMGASMGGSMGASRSGGGQATGRTVPASGGSPAPGEEVVASNDGGQSVPGPSVGATQPPQSIIAPGETGEKEVPDLAPEIDIFPDVAAIVPPKPGDDLGNPDEVLNAASPVVQPAVAIAAVPEPGTLALLGVALLGMGAFRRQRARR